MYSVTCSNFEVFASYFPFVFMIAPLPVIDCAHMHTNSTHTAHIKLQFRFFPSTLLSSCEVFQVILPVGEDAASSREDRAGLGLAQSEYEATDARVWTGWKQLGHLHPCRQGALQVLYKVLDGYPDVRAVAHNQSVDRHSLETVVSRATGSDVWGGSCGPVRRVSSFWCSCRGIWSWPAVLIHYLLKKDFEELFESQFHLEARWQWTRAKRWRFKPKRFLNTSRFETLSVCQLEFSLHSFVLVHTVYKQIELK